MKTAFVVPGRSPVWINEQVRYVANRLTDDGRVLVAFTHRADCGVELPGQVGASTLFGIAPSGYPLWTGRATAALGLRRRHDAVVIVMFDGAVTGLAVLAALIARLRRERVIVHDLRSNGRAGSRAVARSTSRRFGNAVLRRVAERRVDSPPAEQSTPTMLFGLCSDDPQLARLLIDVASAVPAANADRWRFVIQSDDSAIAAAARESPRREIVSLVPGPIADDLVMTSDVLVLRYGRHDDIAAVASHRGVVAVIVGHPVAARVSQRFDGVRLATSDVSSVLVALETARGIGDEPMRSAPEVRSDGDRLVNAVRFGAGAS
jgi:hypothetical protein